MGIPELCLVLLAFTSCCYARSSNHSCPIACTCDLDIFMSSVTCSGNVLQTSIETWTDLLTVAKNYPLLKKLSYQWGLSELPVEMSKFDELVYLNLSQNYITTLRSNVFAEITFMETLDLSFNALEEIDGNAFKGLTALRTLNLSHNSIASLSEKMFTDLHDLRILVLQQNRISSLPSGIFKNLNKLEVLDLSYNYLIYFSSKHFTPLLKLTDFYVNSNLIESFHLDTVEAIGHIPVLDLSNNPLDCSCALSPLKLSIANGTTRLMHSGSTVCAVPRNLAGWPIERVPLHDLNCSAPVIESVSGTKVVNYQQDLYLPCRAAGTPSPAIVWETPWGDTFAHPSMYNLLGDASQTYSQHHSYQGEGLVLISHITMFGNGTLHISKFRGYFAGNFTCIAMNPQGNTSATVNVDIFNFMKIVYIQSFIIGGYCTAVGLVLGICIGTIKVTVLAIQRKLKARREKKKEEEEKKEADEKPSFTVSEVVVMVDEFDDRSDPTPPKTPLLSPYAHTPNSPQKCTTPTEDQAGWLPGNIFETLDEVRWRLRYGVGRRIDKVRCHVQSIRESSNLYMQSIRESSSCAASRVRTGLVVGMETMKYSVQSMREFCGTGDMGGQTVSTISVSTNVDTEQRTQVIKSITYV